MKLFSRRPSEDQPNSDDGDVALDDDQSRRRRRKMAFAGVLLLVVVVAFGCWLGIKAFDAKSNLEQARLNAQQAKDALLQGNTDEATRRADNAASHAQSARDATHSLPWTSPRPSPGSAHLLGPVSRFPTSYSASPPTSCSRPRVLALRCRPTACCRATA